MSNEYNDFLPPPIILHRRNEKYIMLSDGIREYPIFKGGVFVTDNTERTIEDVDIKNNQIMVNGRWYPKGEFEPAIVVKAKGRKKSKGKCR